MTPKPAGAGSVTSSDTSATLPPSRYAGQKDVGRAESLYRSAVSKPDLDYAAQLLFSALAANPEHAEAFRAVLAKIPSFAAARRKMVVRISDLVGNSPADGFLKHLAAYCAAPAAGCGIPTGICIATPAFRSSSTMWIATATTTCSTAAAITTACIG